MDFSTLNTTTKAAGSSASTVASATSPKSVQDTQDRFLKLLVAQMQNQDPMNPMDNAQVTSQMAQIQTVSGISTLDNTVKSLGNQFNQMQALQSVSLVGRSVSFEGNQLNISGGKGIGSYQLQSPATAVKLEVLNSAGVVIDTQQLGAQGTAKQDISWAADKVDPNGKYTFRITATKGTATVGSTTYAEDKVMAVNTSGTSLKLELQRLGLVDYSSVKAID
ncbi:flagellar hook assembly protein FlgD [Roseateles sp. PN1]|uniref:flagellar hook assembly protein FlgD n=1 Tax=Roseateles sp. PN1 TaxID=3137372 RepID=UPI001DE5F51F|nr:flagellar hook assembly protein FlgD [Burkholderiaceae bacterium]